MSAGTDSTTESSAISLPKGGGAISGLGETFQADLFTGTGGFTVPIAVPAGRLSLTPQLALRYGTGGGNGPFGTGWQLSLPGVSRRTSRGIPRYFDEPGPGGAPADVFLLSGSEDLVRVSGSYPGRVRYRPRTEGLHARVEHVRDTSGDYWEVRSRDGLLTRYGTPVPAGAGATWRDPAALTDPDDPDRIFAWRITENRDTHGNLVRYDYLRDAGREPGHRWDQPLISRISYADYGDPAAPSFLVTVDFGYETRPDPFSDYRAGFENRTTLRCTTIRLGTHAADGTTRVSRDYGLTYEQASFSGASLLSRVDVTGVDEAAAATEMLPPLTFDYTRFDPGGRRFVPVTGAGLPATVLSDPSFALVDLHGGGLPDVVELGAAPRVWRNTGNGNFATAGRPAAAPPFALGTPGVQLLDADGDGRPDLLVSATARGGAATAAGYFPMTFGGGWSSRSFRSYRQSPGVSLADPAVKLIDLDGDGLTDVLRSGTRLQCWFNDPDPRLAWTRTAVTGTGGPPVDLSDPSVRLADMTGDGLQDIVLIRSGNIAYWPNLGYGRWGERVTMHGSPRLPDGYDPRKVLLGDVDGDGVADLVYVDQRRVLLWGNRTGNGWTPQPVVVAGTPEVTGTDAVQLSDLRGTGMAGLLFARGSDRSDRPYLRFLDFTGGVKPYLLGTIDNHLGALTTVEYRPSTEDYLRDAASPASRWRTTLPFPVQVVAQVTSADRYSGSRTTSAYRYHHGYWDGVEREFRGFAMVESFDTEVFTGSDDPHHSPPTLTRSWFHLGPVAALQAGDWTELDLRDEYSALDVPLLSRPADQVALLALLPRDEHRAALRAMRGHLVRSELYGLDGTARAGRPYTVTETVVGVRPEAPGVFFPFTIGQRTTQWERGDEPLTRIAFTAGYDAYGYPTAHLDVAVPRGRDPLSAGEAVLATYATTEYARRDDPGLYLVDRIARASTYEVLDDGKVAVTDLPAVLPALRLISHSRTFYDGEEYAGLPLGRLGDHGLPTRAESLAFDDAFLATLYPGASRPVYLVPGSSPAWTPEFPAEFRTLLPPLAGYAHYGPSDVAGSPAGFYVITGRHRYDVHDAARVPRGLPIGSLDQFGAASAVEYDHHDLFPIRTVDPLGLATRAEYDYRVLQPSTVTDVNGNTHTVAVSPAGLVTAEYARGANGEGDRTRPGTRYDYDLLAEPASVRTTRRVHHDSDSEVLVAVHYSDGFGRALQTRSVAEDTLFDESAMTGAAEGRTRASADPDNVVVSGWQVYDNKGRVVRSYEPFFAGGLDYAAPVDGRSGPAVETFYDPRGQVVRTVSPDGSERRILFGVPAALNDPDTVTPTPWESYVYDGNDNAGRTHPAESQGYAGHWNTPAGNEFDALGRTVRSVARNGAAAADRFVTRSAYDIQGRLLTVTDALGRPAFQYTYDLAGRRWRVDSIDAGRRATVLDVLGNPVESRDSRGALTLGAVDVVHRPIRVWARDDAAGPVTLRQRLEYGDGSTAGQPAAERQAARGAYLLGHLVRHYDEAGLLRTDAADFKGNIVQSTRQVIADAPILAAYAAAPADKWNVAPFRVDWTSAATAPLLDPAGYTTDTVYDALNRVVAHTFPADVEGRRRTILPTYNRAGSMEQVRLDDTVYIRRIAYDAKGQRILVVHGNGVMTRYSFDPLTFRLVRMRSETFRTADDVTYQATGTVLQDYGYDRDLVGNVLAVHDRTPGSGIPSNPAALLTSDPALRKLLAAGEALDRQFTYDPVYRLLTATGRENQAPPAGDPWLDRPRGTDLTQAQPCTERYRYDAMGGLLQLVHAGTGGYTRDYTIDAGSNRLQRLTVATRPVDYTYDLNGNLLSEAATRRFTWNHADHLSSFATQTPGAEPSVHAQYLYDAAGNRVTKLVRRQGGAIEVTQYIDEVFEHHRWTGAAAGANNHIHVLDDTLRVALVRVGPGHPDDRGPAVAVHLADHLGSSTAVLDGTGALTNREEYTPYGETSFGSYARKRYRFTGRERDEESGLSHHGARYALVWLGRWAGCDPIGQAGGINQYLYAAANPVGLRDPGGTDPKPASGDSTASPGKLAPSAGTEIAVRNPEGFTLAVPDNFDKPKIRAYKQRIQDPADRAVGIRSRPPGSSSATADIRTANQGLRDAYEASLPGGRRPDPGVNQIDHTVELQNIIRRNGAAPGSDTVRPQDHRVQNGRLNGSQGSRNQKTVNRQLANGAPVDTPAGGVARESDVGKLWNREGFRTGARAVGVYATAGGTYAAIKGVGDDIRDGNAAGAALNTSAYLGGAFSLGGLAARSATLLNAGRVLGAPAAVVGAGLIGARIGTHLYEHHVNKQQSLDAGAWVEGKTGSQVLGGVAAAGTAIGSAAYHAPGAAVEFAKDTWTVNPSNVDWDRTLKPWKW